MESRYSWRKGTEQVPTRSRLRVEHDAKLNACRQVPIANPTVLSDFVTDLEEWMLATLAVRQKSFFKPSTDIALGHRLPESLAECESLVMVLT